MSLAGNLYIIAAPSGAGKTSLVSDLITSVDGIVVSKSHTTRPPRPSEEDGQDYYFIDDARFQAMVAENEFLEHAEVFGYSYGTSQSWVEQQLVSGLDVILEIDWQGAQQIRHLYPQAVSIFILPPSLQALEDRLTRRAQDHADVVKRRLAEARQEIAHYAEFDYLIINDDFHTAAAQLRSIIFALRLQLNLQQQRHKVLLQNLLD